MTSDPRSRPDRFGPTRGDVVIVGTGHGGAQTAIALRQAGYQGSVILIGAEPDPPYERPPLSKEYLAGEKTFERVLIRPAGFWADKDIDLRLGREVVAIDPERRLIACAEGGRIGYGALVWAAGGNPKRLSCPGAGLRGVHSIRGRADVEALKAALPSVSRAAVIGGGYIGLEAAAVLRKLGKQVVLVEAADRVLSRVAGEPLSRFYEAEHRAQGVEIRTGATVDRVEGEESVTAIRLSDGERIPAEMAIVGIGIDPVIGPLEAAGADCGDGVHVDQFCRTSLPDVHAVGDCAAHASRFAGGLRLRIESVQNAHDQANVVARAIARSPEPYAAVPWFWSNQYDIKLQTVGLATGHDDLVLRGDPASRSFSVVYLRQGRVVALDCVNATRDYVQGRAAVLAGLAAPKARLADPSVPLKALAA